jgi:hypothetical protein
LLKDLDLGVLDVVSECILFMTYFIMPELEYEVTQHEMARTSYYYLDVPSANRIRIRK